MSDHDNLTIAEARAAINNMRELSPEARELVRDYWIARMVPEIYGDDDTKDGLRSEVRQLKRWAILGGGFAIALQVIQTFGLQDLIKHGIVILAGGHN